ncbi:hypothetical protein FF38_04393 [Lucilia cuprina]|uniref:Uncharacterized protein n=1 Tax=Lucilia cuprina TaxID=7375 RepID=A0A0L0C6V9_LUCCU|nr:hypothetical protein FF38_04393 [Lucilia cuprina]
MYYLYFLSVRTSNLSKHFRLKYIFKLYTNKHLHIQSTNNKQSYLSSNHHYTLFEDILLEITTTIIATAGWSCRKKKTPTKILNHFVHIDGKEEGGEGATVTDATDFLFL